MLREALHALLSLVRREAPHLSGKVVGDAEAALAQPSIEPAGVVTDATNLGEQIEELKRLSWRMGELFERHQGKNWPDKEGDLFTKLRDEDVPALCASILAALAKPEGTSPPAPLPTQADADALIRLAETTIASTEALLARLVELKG